MNAKVSGFASIGFEIDNNNQYSFESKEKILDHFSKNLVVRAYNHKANYQEQMREIMNFWSDFICGLKG